MTIPEISADALADALAGGARLFDVRESDEYVAGHVPGAVLVPLGSLPDEVDRFRGDGPSYLVCRSGARSLRGCEYLAQHGIDVVNVAGGTIAWIESGHPIATGSTPT